jgi:hypothetical protein
MEFDMKVGSLGVSHHNAMHRMPNPPLRCGFVTGDSGRYVVPTMLGSLVLNNV